MNQCMGCQAGWPFVVVKVGNFKPKQVHQVTGGYPWEIVGCTRERYEPDAHDPGDEDRS